MRPGAWGGSRPCGCGVQTSGPQDPERTNFCCISLRMRDKPLQQPEGFNSECTWYLS